MKKTKLGAKLTLLLCIVTLVCTCFALASCGGGITLNETEKTLYVSDTFKLVATTANEDALVEWESSDASVATVRRGTVTAKKEGTATITATTDAGDTATCTITVLDRNITISQTTAAIDLASGENTITLTATSSVADDVLSWSSSDTSLATVDNGVVTALDVGEVTITAAKGSVKATCVLTITDSDRPADYRVLEGPAQNSTVCANPGVWYYHTDGKGYTFATNGKPTYQDGGVQVKIATASSGENQYFRFRYQPGGADGTELAVGDAYTVTYTVEMNTDGKVTGNKTVTVTANTPAQVTYSGTVQESNSFQITVKNDVQIPTDGLYLRVSNITFTKGATSSGDYSDNGALSLGKNSVVKANPGVWFYNSSDQAVFTADPNRDATSGTLSVTASSWGTDMFYFRYQPDATKDGVAVGDTFTVTFTVKLSVAGQVVYKYDGMTENGGVSYTANLEADVEQTLTLTTTRTENGGPLWIAVPKETTAGATFTVSDITIQKVTADA